MTKEDYVSLEVAKKLKDKGFDEHCCKMYNEKEQSYEYACYSMSKRGFYNIELREYEVAVPTLYEAAKWLRNEHQLHVDVGMCGDYSTDADSNKCDEWNYWTFSSYYTISLHHMHECEGAFDTYEEALNAGILEALELI